MMLKRSLLLLTVLVLAYSAQTQTATKKKKATKTSKTSKVGRITKIGKVVILSPNTIPKGIPYTGKIKDAVRWIDQQGDNVVITTETGIYANKKSENGEGRDADLFASHYLIRKAGIEPTWKVTDRIKDCPLDVQVAFIKKAFQVTDLDKDGMAEVWIMYKTACHGDMSPCDMKIIMYEGQQKFAMRGTNKIKVSETETYGGEYKMDDAFTKGPKVFSDFAKKLWNKNILETWYNNG
jgi:hypothetical protein